MLPNENADFGASTGFVVLLDAAPNGDGPELAAGAPNGEGAELAAGAPNGDGAEPAADAPNGDDDAPDAGAPKGDAFEVEGAPLVGPNPKVVFADSAGFAALPAAAPKGDGALDVPDDAPNVGVELDAPLNGPGVEVGAPGAPKENGDLAAADGVVALVFGNGFVGAGDAPAGCELLVTPKLNLGVELEGAGVGAEAEGAEGAVAGGGVEEVLKGFDATPKLNFSGPDAAAAEVGVDVFAGSVVVETAGAAVSGLAKANGDGAAGCDGGGPIPMRDSNEAPGVAFACSMALVESLDALPKGETVVVVACCAAGTPNPNIGFDAVLVGADVVGAVVEGVEPWGAAGLAKKLGREDVVDAGAAAAGAAGFAKKLGIEVPV